MKRIISLLLCLSMTTPVLAQERAVQDIPPGEDQITPMRKGEAAPYDGQLFSNPTSLRWANWLKQYQLRLQLDEDYNKRMCAAETDYRDRLLEIERQKYTEVTGSYQVQVATRDNQIQQLRFEASNPPWYKTVWFGFTVGVVVTAAAVGVGYVSGR